MFQSPLHLAAEIGDLEIVKFFVTKGENIDSKNLIR